MKYRLIAAFAISAAAGSAMSYPAHAEGTVTATQLMQSCTSSKVPDERQCIGYIAGAVDQVSANPTLKGTLCPLPTGVQLKDVKAALIKYGKAHSERMGDPGIVFLNDAVKDRYPCS